VTAAAQASSSSTLSEGTLTIELGSYGGGTPAADFSTKSGSSAISISIGSGETSLSALRDKINAAGAGVSASIITDSSGARLSLRSSATGAENAFRITASETADDGDPTTGLSALAYDASAASSPMARTMTSADAQVTVNGVPISSASNTLSNVIEGLTLNLSKTTDVAVELTVASDKASVKTAVTDFITAFNAIASFIGAQTAYDSTTKTGGAMQGDQSTLALQSQLRAVINQASTGSSTWSRMSDIGITMQKDGSLAADDTKLDNALGNLPEMKKLLAADGTGSADSGFVRRFKNLADAALNSTGLFATRKESIQSSLTSNSKSQDMMQRRLDATQARLQAQYSALDTQMAMLSNLSTYMTQQITQYNKNTA
jgi:flagellar hook-associated protein 2